MADPIPAAKSPVRAAPAVAADVPAPVKTPSRKIKPTGTKPAPRVADAPALPPPAAAPIPALPAPAAKDEHMDTIDTATTKAETLFNDASSRAKGAVEKSQKLMEDAADFGRGNVEALVESSKIAARGFESLGQDAAAYAKKSFEEATAAAKQMSAVKSPTEFFKLQSDYARNAFDSLVAESSRHAEAMLKLAGEVAQPLSNRVAIAAEKIKVGA